MILQGLAQARVADVLLSHQVVVDPTLCVADDEKRAAGLAHFHLLLLRLREVKAAAFVLFNQQLLVLLELLAESHQVLRLIHVASDSRFLRLAHQLRDLVVDVQHGFRLLRHRPLVQFRVHQIQPLLSLHDLAVHFVDHVGDETNEFVLDVDLAVTARRFLILLSRLLIVELRARTKVGSRVDKQVVWTERVLELNDFKVCMSDF